MGGEMDMGSGGLGAGIALAGLAMSQNDRDNARKNQQSAVQQWLNLHVPDPAQQQVYFQQYMQTGRLDPQIEQAMKASGTELANVHTDPALQDAQMKALQQLQNEGLSGGLTLADQATQNDAINSSNAAARGRQGAIVNDFAQRGLGGSGLSLVAQMQNAQDATQNQSNASLKAAADARSRALQAVMAGGQLGGQMQAQQYNQKANTAKAQDSINLFNTQNAQSVGQRNAAAANSAQRYNLDLQQNVSNANTDLMNRQQAYNKSLLQQQYDNQLKKTQGTANAQQGYANYLSGDADATAKQWAGIGSGVGKLGSAYAAGQKNNDGSNNGGMNNENNNYSDGTNKNVLGDFRADDEKKWAGGDVGNGYTG